MNNLLLKDPKRQTYGQLITAHNDKISKDGFIQDPREVLPDMMAPVINRINQLAFDFSRKDAFRNKDFYLVLIFRKPPGGAIMPHVLVRHSCPTPVFNQHVFKFNYKKQNIKFMWSLPALDVYKYISSNMNECMNDKNLGVRQLSEFVLMDKAGKLLDWAKRENREDIKISNVIIKSKEEY